MDMSRGSKFKDGIRIAAAAYLIYLGVKVISDAVKGATGEHEILFVIFGVVFIAVGAWIGIWSVKSLLKETGENAGGSETEKENQNTDAGESVSGEVEPKRVEGKKAEPEKIETDKAEDDLQK